MPRFRSPFKFRWFVDNTAIAWEGSPSQGRKLTYQALELGSNDLPVILVAALGFFTGSYILYVSGAVLPMLGYVYWHDERSSQQAEAFNSVTVAGCIFGMVLFGVLADIFGRRKMYGHELIILMAGTIGVVMSSAGFTPLDTAGQDRANIDFTSYGSMSIGSWLVFWRFLSGVGIGGEYPLSAIVASEFAPTHTRPRMLATVFLMRPLGITAGALVSLVVTNIVTARNNESLSLDASSRAIDQIWRWVIGLALIPAFITAGLRFTTPESPRYTLDVLDDPRKAYEDADRLKRSWAPYGFDARPVITNELESTATAGTGATAKTEGTEIASSGREPAITIKQYFWTEGNWRYLFVTSTAWFLADFPRFADGLNNARTLSTIWYGVNTSDPDEARPAWNSNMSNVDMSIFSILKGNSTRLLLMQCAPSIISSVLLVAFITRVNRRLLSWVMFLVSGCVYLLAGGVLRATAGTSNSGINIALFAVIQFANFFGVAPLTFLLPAELFPTKYRASCHGIAAAFGKAGAVLASGTLRHVMFGHIKETTQPSIWLGYVFMIFAIPMFLGCGVCWLWMPDMQDSSGKSKTLEELAKGRRAVQHDEHSTRDDDG